jgi:DNA-binding LacI/PurR family transcriptional regulator
MEIQTYYQSIYNYLLNEISTGKLSVGDKVPTELELAKQFNVSRITAKRALKMLEEKGCIVRFRAKGSFVTDTKPVPVNKISPKQFIGIVLSEVGESFGQRMFYTIEKACKELGYHLIIKFSHDSVVNETEAIKELMDMDVAGILIQPVHGEYYNEEILKLVLAKKSLVFIDRKMPGISVPAVIADNNDGARQGMEYLLKLGHRNIGLYPGSPIKGTSAVEERWQGSCDALIKAHIPINPLFCCDFSGNPAPICIQIIENHLRQYPEITAAFSFNYPLAYYIKEAVEKTGRSVPGDFPIVCFDMPAFLKDSPPFTCLYEDEESMGKKAMELLSSIISGKHTYRGDILVPVTLIERQPAASLIIPR